MSNTIQLRRGTESELGGITLAAGEAGFTTDTKEIFVGDGANHHVIGSVKVGALASRPAAGAAGRIFHVNSGDSTGNTYIDDGVAWQTVFDAAHSHDIISEGDTSVEIVDTGSGGAIKFKADNTQWGTIDASGVRFGNNPLAPVFGNLQLVIDGAHAPLAAIGYSDAFYASGMLSLGHIRGSIDSPDPIQNDDYIGMISFGAFDGATLPSGITMIGYATEDWDSESHGSELIISSTPNGSPTAVAALGIGGNGKVVVGDSTFGDEKLRVSGAVQLGAADSTNDGTIQWTGSALQYYDGEWKTFENTDHDHDSDYAASDHIHSNYAVSGDEGEIQFSDGSSAHASSSKLYWDTTNEDLHVDGDIYADGFSSNSPFIIKENGTEVARFSGGKLGVGIDPVYNFHLDYDGQAAAAIVGHDDGSYNHAYMAVGRSKGTAEEPSEIEVDNTIGAYIISGYHSVAGYVASAGMYSQATESWNGSGVGTKLMICVTPNAGAGAPFSAALTLENDYRATFTSSIKPGNYDGTNVSGGMIRWTGSALQYYDGEWNTFENTFHNHDSDYATADHTHAGVYADSTHTHDEISEGNSKVQVVDSAEITYGRISFTVNDTWAGFISSTVTDPCMIITDNPSAVALHMQYGPVYGHISAVKESAAMLGAFSYSDTATDCGTLYLFHAGNAINGPSYTADGHSLGEVVYAGFDNGQGRLTGVLRMRATESYSGDGRGSEFDIRHVKTGEVSYTTAFAIGGDSKVTLEQGTGINKFSTTLLSTSDDEAPTSKAVATFCNTNYADATHNHDSDYAAIGHVHTGNINQTAGDSTNYLSDMLNLGVSEESEAKDLVKLLLNGNIEFYNSTPMIYFSNEGTRLVQTGGYLNFQKWTGSEYETVFYINHIGNDSTNWEIGGPAVVNVL